MIGKLIFKLPEEQIEFELAQKASALCAFIEEYSNKLSRRYKHADPSSPEAYREYEKLRVEFYDKLEEHGLNELMWK